MTTDDKIRITMSERRPLSIVKSEWPIVARADWYNGEHECQANTIRKIRVRQHADGRRIVYGLQEEGNGGQYIGTRNPEGGYLLEAGASEEETVRAIRRVAGIIGDDDLGNECIADLPAESLGEPEPIAKSDGPTAILLALLVQAAPHVPAHLAAEIRAVLAGHS